MEDSPDQANATANPSADGRALAARIAALPQEEVRREHGQEFRIVGEAHGIAAI